MANDWFHQFTPDATYPDLGTYTILEPNPDAGKSGVVYAGKYLAVAYTDSREVADQIVFDHNRGVRQ